MFENSTVEIDDEEIHELDDGLNLDPEKLENEDEPPKPKEEEVKVKDDPDKEEFHGRVQKRINKLTYEVKSRDSRIEELENRLNAYEEEREKSKQQSTESEVNSRIAQLRQKKIEYMELGEFDKVDAIDDEIIDLKVQKRQAPVQKQPEPKPQPQGKQNEYVPSDEEVAWLDRNDWWYHPKKQEQRDKATKIFTELVNEGYDSEDKEFYDQLDKRLNSKRPDAAPPPAGVDRGGAATGSNKVAFTAADKQKMLDWGLDPNNVEQRKEYLKNKVA